MTEQSAAAPERETEGEARAREKRHERAKLMQVRAADIEPYAGLRYLSKLFRLMALILLVLLATEIATGLRAQGLGATWSLLAEAGRLLVMAGILWGAGDLAILLIDIGHDVRTTSILLAREWLRANGAPDAEEPDLLPPDGPPPAGRR